MNTIKNLLSPLTATNNNPLQDTLKLVVIGGTMETARRASVSAWNGFIDSFFLTAHFSQEDYPYDWLMHWLSKQPAWGRSREFDITTRSVSRHGLTQSTSGDLEDEDEDEHEVILGGHKKRKVALMPSLDTTHTIYYRGHWLRITRSKRFQEYGSYGELKISVVARNNDIIKKLVLEAKREYEKDAEHRVHIFMADTTYGCWRWNGARQKRPMSSIVLEPGVKDMILADCKDFLCSEDWYAERGIPFRRGYLLYGVPGSGKTSLIHSLAGELGLDIYVVSLSSKGMSDNTLSSLMGNVPSRCILLLEDLDAAFTRGVSRDENSTGAPTSSSSSSTSTAKNKDESNDGSTLSLSGLLNSLDGVAAAEGRLLFATTNHIERLDPALSRPGRMDVWVNFKHATKWQAEGIFKCFFPAKSSTNSSSAISAVSGKAGDDPASQEGLAVPKRKQNTRAIPLLTEEEISDLAKRFADAIPEDELSVAALQGYLLRNKTRPRECVDEVGAWVIQERETKAQLKKEKEEREAKEKKEAEAEAQKNSNALKTKEETSTAGKSKDGNAKAEQPSASTESCNATGEKTTQESSDPEAEINNNIEADIEGSVTSEEDAEQAPKDSEEASTSTKEKWVAVKAQPPDQSV
ncbi:nucleoside triphosphate hydrolase protein [Wolfiporia cocos MD-104 SS10]|uniref:Nucleoside triphosphate hydrolase protein n=1 Tax=Wolfiporia cocos (strain MD-104) TaxID=742152 RepID=A0A2H3JIF4_WOLCO|nr:nucleoside triphosphate hydrolase protein [Wolfiporia cocos MD-104 SS10]